MANGSVTPGIVIGRLTVLAQGAPHNGQPTWVCRCACGTEKAVLDHSLRYDRVHSCGCGRIRHGRCATPEYGSWRSILGRCLNPNDAHWSRYGGRGITVCARWRDFATFFADVGPRPSPRHSIDRIDNDRGYEPGNVRWATMAEQNNNRSNNRYVDHDGVTRTLSAWSRVLGIHVATLHWRLNKYGRLFP